MFDTASRYCKTLKELVKTDATKGVTCAKLDTVKILKFGTPQTIPIIVLKIEKFDVTLH